MTPGPPPPPPPPPPGGTEDRSVGLRRYGLHRGGRPLVRTRDVRPIYAPMVIASGVKGDVVVEASVDARGKVAQVRVVQTQPMLTQATIDAVRSGSSTRRPSQRAGLSSPSRRRSRRQHVNVTGLKLPRAPTRTAMTPEGTRSEETGLVASVKSGSRELTRLSLSIIANHDRAPVKPADKRLALMASRATGDRKLPATCTTAAVNLRLLLKRLCRLVPEVAMTSAAVRGSVASRLHGRHRDSRDRNRRLHRDVQHRACGAAAAPRGAGAADRVVMLWSSTHGIRRWGS